MIRIYPEQLKFKLQKRLYSCYFLIGTEQLFIQEVQKDIMSVANQKGFKVLFNLKVDDAIDWKKIFFTCQERSLFIKRQILVLHLPKCGTNQEINEKLFHLSEILHTDILLILIANKIRTTQENTSWYKQLSVNSVMVPCKSPEYEQLPHWLARRIKTLKIILDKESTKLLCYYYEGNIHALSQILEQLAFIYPNSYINIHAVKQAINDIAHFQPHHWSNALLEGQGKRALHILYQMRSENSEPLILMRTLQKDLFLLLNYQRELPMRPLYDLFNESNLWSNRRELFRKALKRINSNQLIEAIHLLKHIELKVKQNDLSSVWLDLETLSLILCCSSFSFKFFYG